MEERKREIDVDLMVNPAQMACMAMPAKTKYILMSRAAGKSFISGYEIHDNVVSMPRGITTITQATIGQALTKTLPSAFKMLEMLGYKRYDGKTGTGDYVVCRRPPEGWLRPLEHVMSFDYLISFSNGHCLYLLSQALNGRGPNADYNITDEALTIDKELFDKEVAPTNRGNEQVFGRLSSNPVAKHHGSTFLSSMIYDPSQKWLLEPASYYEQEKGIHLADAWNHCVDLQTMLIQAKLENRKNDFQDIWNEIQRVRSSIAPFVSKDGVLFLLGSVFDNIANVGMQYIISQYEVMENFAFQVEILNRIVDKVDNCYYALAERHRYYGAVNDGFVRDFAEDVDFDWRRLGSVDCRMDADCVPNRPLEVVVDYGSSACFMVVGQQGNFDWYSKRVLEREIMCFINEFFAKPGESDATMVDALMDKFCDYYEMHSCKQVVFFRDRYGDAKRANSSKTYNECAILRLRKRGWKVQVKTHGGIEPPQHEKYLLMSAILGETDSRYSILRFNASKCKFTMISMNGTKVKLHDGKFEKDKRSERNSSIPAEEATHLGDCVDKMVWTKYSYLLKQKGFVDARM